MTDVDKFLYGDRSGVNDPLAQADWSSKKLVWIPSEKLGFEPGSVKDEHGDECTVELTDSGRKVVLNCTHESWRLCPRLLREPVSLVSSGNRR